MKQYYRQGARDSIRAIHKRHDPRSISGSAWCMADLYAQWHSEVIVPIIVGTQAPSAFTPGVILRINQLLSQ